MFLHRVRKSERKLISCSWYDSPFASFYTSALSILGAKHYYWWGTGYKKTPISIRCYCGVYGWERMNDVKRRKREDQEEADLNHRKFDDKSTCLPSININGSKLFTELFAIESWHKLFLSCPFFNFYFFFSHSLKAESFFFLPMNVATTELLEMGCQPKWDENFPLIIEALFAKLHRRSFP